MARANAELKVLTLDAVAKGATYREAADLAGVTATTVLRWLREAAPTAVPVEPAPVPAGAEIDSSDTLESTRALQRQFLADAAAARAAGHYTAASSMMRQAGELAPTIAKLAREKGEDRDHVRYSTAEIAVAEESVLRKIAALAARPLLCAHCGRALSVELAKSADVRQFDPE